MLRPNEFIQLIRQDVVLPEDALLKEEVMYIHICNPKTARFARIVNMPRPMMPP